LETTVQIEHLHKQFRAEIDTAAQAFFLWRAINRRASEDRGIYRGLNEQALSWNILTHSLQTTFFIVLGRLFDTDGDAFSVHAFLRSCIENVEQFSKDALRQRKLANSSGGEPEWLDEYINSAYVAVEKDFQIMRSELSKRQKRYEKVYRPIRNMVVAHKDAATMDNVDALFGKTNVAEIEELLCFLHQIQETVFQLLHNGRMTKLGDHPFTEEEYVGRDVFALLERLRV
jgi:DNA-binding ferritin-like protein